MFSKFSDLIIRGLGLEWLIVHAEGANAGQWVALLILAWFLLVSSMVRINN